MRVGHLARTDRTRVPSLPPGSAKWRSLLSGVPIVWLKGDFHAHSTLSDGVLTPRRFIDEAEREGLDFFAITDHNVWSYPHFADSDRVLVIAGVEVTMPYGHFNVFSTAPDEPDWMRDLPEPGYVDHSEAQRGEAAALVTTVAREGLRASINHPLLFPWEWTDVDAPLAAFRYLEVWNDPTWPENRLANPAALAMWTRWLNAGLRITAVGGSDFHNPEKMIRGDGLTVDGHRIGIPRSYVDAQACTPEAILAAVDRGRVYVTMGPTVEFVVETADHTASMGDTLGAVERPLLISAQAWGRGDLEIRVIQNGESVATAAGRNPGLEHRLDPNPAESAWVRIDVCDADEVVAFTNPVYFGADREPSEFDYGSFTELSAAFAIQERWQQLPTDDQEENNP